MNYIKDTNSKIITVEILKTMKQQQEKICCITAYDALFAKIFDDAGIDLILVGDSLANVFQGKETTLSVTLAEIIYHTKAVKSTVRRSFVVADMPFMTYQVNSEKAVRNAGKILKETGCNAVKIEGCTKKIIEAVENMNEIGIPVMGHLGLTPQSINKFGNYKTRGTEKIEAQKILDDAHSLEKAGVFAIVLEKIPSHLAKEITENISVPTIGIGAGKFCDGQILVYSDMLGMNIDFNPRFVRKYADLYNTVKEAVTNYSNDIKKSDFPNETESY